MPAPRGGTLPVWGITKMRVALCLQGLSWAGCCGPATYPHTQKLPFQMRTPAAPHPARKIPTRLLGGGIHGGAEGPGTRAVVSPDGCVVHQVAPQAVEPGRRLPRHHLHSARRALLSTGPVPHLGAETRQVPPSRPAAFTKVGALMEFLV